jgi:hypothetical protein
VVISLRWSNVERDPASTENGPQTRYKALLQVDPQRVIVSAIVARSRLRSEKQGVNIMRILIALGLTTVLGLLTSMAQAAGLPLVISATVDHSRNTLTISGQNFGSNPLVTLDALAFPA